MSARYVRLLLSDSDPLLFGQYPDRPAPAHVLNGFVAASLGVSSRQAAIRALLVPGADLPEEFAYLREADWASDQASFARFRSDLSTIFNPDRRLWEQFGSPVPVHALLASSDASDDGYGPLMWEIVRRRVDEDEYLERLRSLLEPSVAYDPISAVAQLIVKDATVARKREREVGDAVWFGDLPNAAGRRLATQLAEFVDSLSHFHPNVHRLLQIQHLARGLFLGTFLGLLLGPNAAASDDESPDLVESGALVVWAGTPPGPADHPMVAASARSFQVLVERKRRALFELLRSVLSNAMVPSHTPASQRRAAVIRQILIDRGESPARANTAIAYFENKGVPLGAGTLEDERWARAVLDTAYTTAELTKAIRTTGRKVGIVAPDRGSGSPRFVVETPLLGTLVAALCVNESIPLEEFVDRAREKLGLIVGQGTRDDLPDELGLWESPGIARQLLRDNQDMLRERLVRAGLAVEYSDGHTEVSIA